MLGAPVDRRTDAPPAGATNTEPRSESSLGRSNDKRRRRRGSHGPGGDAGGARPRIVLTPEGVPAAVPDAPPTSAVVFVSDESRAQYPWLPGRVIAWSVWRGPEHVRVQIDEHGKAIRLGARPLMTRLA